MQLCGGGEGRGGEGRGGEGREGGEGRGGGGEGKGRGEGREGRRGKGGEGGEGGEGGVYTVRATGNHNALCNCSTALCHSATLAESMSSLVSAAAHLSMM